MADPWTHAVNLDRAVRNHGVAQARVDLDDYLGAKDLVRGLWTGTTWRNLRERVSSRGEEVIPARVLLGYLRGYFLYREIPENDQALWPDFLRDLGIPDRTLPKPLEYDRLWEALWWHEETRGKLRYYRAGDRDFVGTLDGIFHFRALRLKELKRAFLAYFREGSLPESARAYGRIFARLRDALQVLLEEDDQVPNLSREEDVLAFLEGVGLNLGEPNPIRLLFRRSPEALADLYRELKGSPPVKPTASRRFRHPQVRVEPLDYPEGLAEVRAVLNREKLVEGWTVYGQVVMEDGRFRSFTWVPRLTEAGEPIPEPVEVTFEEGEKIRFRLHHKAYAVRFEVPRWRLGEPLAFRAIHFDPTEVGLRFLLASQGEPSATPEALTPDWEEGATEDELIVLVQVADQDWRRIASLRVTVEVALEGWVDEDRLWISTMPPGQRVRVRCWAREKLLGEREVYPAPGGSPVVEAGLVPLVVEVEAVGVKRHFILGPRGWPEGWLKMGVAL